MVKELLQLRAEPRLGSGRMNDLDKNIDKLKKVVKVSTLGDTEKLDLIIFLDEVALLEVEE